MQKITIAIDGYSSCGKSTLAKALAQKLHYTYVDTGAMYRAVTLYYLDLGFLHNPLNIQRMEEVLPSINLTFQFNNQRNASDIYLNEKNVEGEIRDMVISKWVSQVSAIKAIREKMGDMQRQMSAGGGIVMDGRDIGTHIFPHADLKIFLTANQAIRTQRRLEEFQLKGIITEKKEVEENLIFRDKEDSNRVENPLRKAEDAIELDNSEFSREEQLSFVLDLAKMRGA